ncbi:UNVERIFIED_CONTAM: hypothetical protein B566_EDAN018989 [Ephemera danica]|nr:hypothetical protein B566_EDAN018989 [Ephemera danica]
METEPWDSQCTRVKLEFGEDGSSLQESGSDLYKITSTQELSNDVESSQELGNVLVDPSHGLSNLVKPLGMKMEPIQQTSSLVDPHHGLSNLVKPHHELSSLVKPHQELGMKMEPIQQTSNLVDQHHELSNLLVKQSQGLSNKVEPYYVVSNIKQEQDDQLNECVDLDSIKEEPYQIAPTPNEIQHEYVAGLKVEQYNSRTYTAPETIFLSEFPLEDEEHSVETNPLDTENELKITSVTSLSESHNSMETEEQNTVETEVSKNIKTINWGEEVPMFV